MKILHEQVLAAILDVICNHAGEMNALKQWDKAYYFRHNDDGTLTNANGCGSYLQTEKPMVQIMIIDSLLHLKKITTSTSCRFDLAELLGRIGIFAKD